MEKLVSGARKLGLDLKASQIEKFQLYYQELMSWNEKMNLTAITDYDEVQTKHFLDSLSIAVALGERKWAKGSFRLLDVGTGAGMPGVPLKILLPNIRLLLLDSIAKKALFLRHLVTQLRLEDTEVVTGRAEDVGHHSQFREQFDLTVSRAVGKLPAVAELTLPFCRVGGIAVIPKKGQVEQEIDRANRAITLLGGKLAEIKNIHLEGLVEERFLVVIEKVSPTSLLYPRRAGTPQRHPL